MDADSYSEAMAALDPDRKREILEGSFSTRTSLDLIADAMLPPTPRPTLNPHVKPEVAAEAELLTDLSCTSDVAWPIRVVEFEGALRKIPGVKTGKATEDWCPVGHRFEDGYYFRELTSPAGVLGITKIHRRKHTFVLLEGTISVWSEFGVVLLEAPHYGVTMPGTKRVIYPHTHVRFLTVHELEEMSVEEAEATIFANTFDQLLGTGNAEGHTPTCSVLRGGSTCSCGFTDSPH